MGNFASVNPKNLFNNVYEDYDRYVYVPVILVFLSVIVLLAGYLTPGSALNLGQDFTGGTTIKYELPADYDTNQINQIFSSQGYPGSNAITVGENQSILQVTVPPPEVNRTEAVSIRSDNSIRTL